MARHFEIGEEKREGKQIRFLGNGGLIIDPAKDVYYHFADDRGGDAITLWHYCQTGSHDLDAGSFYGTCVAMLSEIGIYVPTEGGINWGGALDVFAHPALYSAGRMGSSEQTLMVAALNVMKRAGKTTVKFSVRDASEETGMGKETVSKAFKRLIELGWLQLATAATWCVDGQDSYLAAKFDARAYSLTESALNLVPTGENKTGTVLTNRGVVSTVPVSITLDSGTISRYLNYAPFVHGAKIADTKLGIGKIGLLAVAALVAGGELTAEELAQAAGKSEASMRRICNNLELLGLVEVDRTGKEISYSLTMDWEDVLSQYKTQVNKAITLVTRALRYAEERISRAGLALHTALGNGLRGQLVALVQKLRQRVFALNQELKIIVRAQEVMYA